MTEITADPNATIANAVNAVNAVNARIEAAVLEALSGVEVIGAIRDATKAAVASILATERPLIEDEVRKALRRGVAKMAEGIASSLADNAANGYGVTVELKLPGERY